MPTPILATKIFAPPLRPEIVPRPRLMQHLNEGLHRKLTLIAAAAGFGKTTLISEWVTHGRLNVAWLSLDEGDNDLVRFLAYLIAALQTVPKDAAAGNTTLLGAVAWDALHASQLVSAEAILTTLLNDIATIPAPVILVLDDYHLIDAPAIDNALTFLLQHLPPKMHLVITTREDPNLPLARLRAQRQLTELRASDLRFTLPEATDFLNQVMSLSLTPQDIATLETRTEGWITGLQLAALALQGTISLQGQEDATRFIQSFSGSHRFVMDYLVEEVLRQQPDSIQTFLFRTSILTRLCGPLCDAVLRSTPGSGQATLTYLERANLLVIPLDHQREWYRYHHLLADALQTRLLKENPNQVADLHLRASFWYEENTFGPEAIHHALAAQAFERAADLIEPARSVMRGNQFRSTTWLGWARALPDEFIRTRPQMAIGFAWEMLFSGELEAAASRLQDVDRLLAQARRTPKPAMTGTASKAAMNEEELQALRALSAIAWAFHAQARGDVAGTEEHARRALALASEADYYTRGFASSLLGLACLTNGALAAAFTYLVEARANLRGAGNLLFATSVTYILADIRMTQGRLREAIATYEQALHLVTAHGAPLLPGTANLYLGLGELAHEQGHWEAAREYLRQSEEIGQQGALDNWPYSLYLVQAQMKQTQGDLDGALVLLDAAARLYHRNPVPDLRPAAARRARLWLRQGRLADAFAWAHECGLSFTDDLAYRREFEHITLARVLLASYAQNQHEQTLREAIDLLERLWQAAEAGGRRGSEIEILVLLALAYQAQGNLPLALGRLEMALALAEPEGYVRVFVDEGRPMAELLVQVKAQDGAITAYTQELLKVFTELSGDQSTDLTAGSVPSLDLDPPAELLSQREREVLQLVAQGLSNNEIAAQLYLAVDTVKGHNRRIFVKLQVGRRTEAVRRGRELGLLEP